MQIQQENQTLATITLQNYFRLYDKLSGMTGTAQTEAAELHQIYKLGVVPIPTNKPMVRQDETDIIYKNEDAKFAAVIDDIAERHEAGQPVLVGTASVAKSERISSLLLRKGIPHEVLNAKQHAREAAIIANAGRKGAVTVATNMAGRGTDIMLGGNPEFAADLTLREKGLSPDETPEEYEAGWADALEDAKEAIEKEHDEVVDLGGLYVLGTERHESRRIDNQLRGRSGRQGDPGESRFYLSLGDDLMVRMSGDRVAADDDDAARAGGHADRAAHGLQGDPVGPDPGRAAELRDPQERPQVRRGHEQAAHRHLRRAAPGARGRGPVRPDPRDDRRRRHQLRRRAPPARATPRSGTSTSCGCRSRRCTRSR